MNVYKIKFALQAHKRNQDSQSPVILQSNVKQSKSTSPKNLKQIAKNYHVSDNYGYPSQNDIASNIQASYRLYLRQINSNSQVDLKPLISDLGSFNYSQQDCLSDAQAKKFINVNNLYSNSSKNNHAQTDNTESEYYRYPNQQKNANKTILVFRHLNSRQSQDDIKQSTTQRKRLFQSFYTPRSSLVQKELRIQQISKDQKMKIQQIQKEQNIKVKQQIPQELQINIKLITAEQKIKIRQMIAEQEKKIKLMQDEQALQIKIKALENEMLIRQYLMDQKTQRQQITEQVGREVRMVTEEVDRQFNQAGLDTQLNSIQTQTELPPELLTKRVKSYKEKSLKLKLTTEAKVKETSPLASPIQSSLGSPTLIYGESFRRNFKLKKETNLNPFDDVQSNQENSFNFYVQNQKK